MSTKVVWTTSTEAANRLRIARVAAAGRIMEQHRIERSQKRREIESGSTEEFCFICSRCTDHRGEHTPEQIAAWRAKDPYVLVNR